MPCHPIHTVSYLSVTVTGAPTGLMDFNYFGTSGRRFEKNNYTGQALRYVASSPRCRIAPLVQGSDGSTTIFSWLWPRAYLTPELSVLFFFFFFFTIQPQSQTDCAVKSGSHRNLKVGEARRHQVGRILSFLTLIRYRNVGGGG